MAHLHFRRTRYKSGGKAASARVEYVTRQTVTQSEVGRQRLDYMADGTREDLVCTASRNLPTWAQDNPHSFFQAAERYERVNGVAFEEWKITLPVELTTQQNIVVADDLVEAIAGARLPCTYAVHNPKTLDGERDQPHVHLLMSARQTDGIERTPEDHFRRYSAAHPERGGAQKEASMNMYHATRAHRLLITDVLNIHLEQAGLSVRVHPGTLTERGIGRDPEPKLIPQDSAKYRAHGDVSATMQRVLDVRAAKVPLQALERNTAHAYWEDRKAQLGLTRDLALEEQLTRVRMAREGAMTQKPERLALTYRQDQTEVVRTVLRRPHERLQARLTRHHEHEEAVTPGLRARIFEDEHSGYRY